MEVGGSGLVARRDNLHRRNIPEGREDDLRPGRFARRPFGPLQLEPRRQNQARHRHTRWRRDRRRGAQGPHPRGRGTQHVEVNAAPPEYGLPYFCHYFCHSCVDRNPFSFPQAIRQEFFSHCAGTKHPRQSGCLKPERIKYGRVDLRVHSSYHNRSIKPQLYDFCPPWKQEVQDGKEKL